MRRFVALLPLLVVLACGPDAAAPLAPSASLVSSCTVALVASAKLNISFAGPAAQANCAALLGLHREDGSPVYVRGPAIGVTACQLRSPGGTTVTVRDAGSPPQPELAKQYCEQIAPEVIGHDG